MARATRLAARVFVDFIAAALQKKPLKLRAATWGRRFAAGRFPKMKGAT